MESKAQGEPDWKGIALAAVDALRKVAKAHVEAGRISKDLYDIVIDAFEAETEAERTPPVDPPLSNPDAPDNGHAVPYDYTCNLVDPDDDVDDVPSGRGCGLPHGECRCGG
jgi:hypothetical protein